MNRYLRIGVILICAILLLLVRAFEDRLFYDPLLDYFHGDYKILPLPEMDFLALLGGVAFRYFLNAIISMAIIWLVFRDKGIMKLSLLIYGLLFIVFAIIFSFIVYTSKGTDHMLLLFYVRRFLIQPIFLLILLPAFYFQKQKAN